MILFINTTDFNGLHFAVIDKEVKSFNKELVFNENYRTNEFLQKFLKQNKVDLKKLSKVIVCSGPGSFTGIRVGVSLAQALGYALQIPVVAIPKNKVPKDLAKLETLKLPDKLVLHYGAKPNITLAKKKARSQQ